MVIKNHPRRKAEILGTKKSKEGIKFERERLLHCLRSLFSRRRKYSQLRTFYRST